MTPYQGDYFIKPLCWQGFLQNILDITGHYYYLNIVINFYNKVSDWLYIGSVHFMFTKSLDIDSSNYSFFLNQMVSLEW